jgi:tetratricopeptide (TPR) repeat protein
MYVTYIVLYQAAGLKPFLYHLANVLLHCGTVIMVFFLARRLPWPGEKSSSLSLLAPFLSSLLFAVHPIHTEVVMWVAALPDVAMTLFFTLSLYLYMKAAEGSRTNGWALVFSIASYATALLFKEPAITFPVILVAYDLSFKRPGSVLPWRRYLPYAAVTVLYLAARAHALGGMAPFNRYAALTASETIINIISLFPQYLRMLLVPTGLNAFYTFHPAGSLVEPRVLLSLLITAIFLSALVISFKKNRPVFFSLALLVIPLLPALYLPALGENPMAERYLYLPSVGFVLLAGLAVTWLLSRMPGRMSKALSAVVLAAFVGAGIGAIVCRTSVWKDEFSLWADTVAKSGDSATAHRYYGYGLYTQNKLPEAIEQYKISLEIDGKDPDAHHNLAVAYHRLGRLDEAIVEYWLALTIQPHFSEALTNLGSALTQQGRLDDARASCQAAVRENSNSAEAHSCLGIIYGSSGMLDRAISEFQEAARLNPDNPAYKENLAKGRRMKEGGSGN